MRLIHTIPRALLGIFVSVVLSACIQFPTEKQEVVDLRPHLSFSLPEGFDPAGHRLIIDNLDMGLLANYLAGQQTLRVLPGMHVVRIELRGKTVFLETVFLGDGATRTLKVGAQ